MPVTLVISDFHAPFGNPHAIDFLSDLKREYKPKIIVNIGDEVDACSLSDWDSDPDGMSAGAEHEAAVKQLRGMYKLFPKMLVCESNHGKRIFRKAFKSGIPRVFLRAYREFLDAPQGWQWADHFEIDKVVYQHGETYSGASGALKAARDNRRSTVIGHTHSFAGVQFSATKFDSIFALNVGCLIDLKAYAFKYGLVHPNKPVLGAGIVIDGVEPRFIPLLKS